MKNQSITEAMLQFIEESPTAFHAAANVEALLLENGFEKLENLAEGALVPGGSYYTTQNGSAVLAVKIPENPAKGFRIAASHSDSPCFKIKEVPEMKVENTYVKLNVEKYGGMILSPWLDRPLSVAGRVAGRKLLYDAERFCGAGGENPRKSCQGFPDCSKPQRFSVL